MSSIGGCVAMAFTGALRRLEARARGDRRCLRVELHSSHVQVALIEPGSVATPIWDKSREQRRPARPAGASEQYGDVPAAIDKALEDTAQRGVPPERVAATIERALSARRMRARYVDRARRARDGVGKWVLPDLLFDRLMRRALGV